MKSEREENLDYVLDDVIMGKPHDFRVGRKQFYIYPCTFAKKILLKRFLQELAIDNSLLSRNTYAEALRLVNEHRGLCCNIIAIYCTPNTYKDFTCRKALAEKRNVLAGVNSKDLASLLLTILTSDHTAELMDYLGISKEQERMRNVLSAKEDNRSSVHFGGLSVFGSFIAPLKEMGYSDEEILYERGYTFLRLLLADKPNSVYLTDEELSRLPALAVTQDSSLNASDPKNTEKIIASLSNRGVKIKQKSLWTTER